MKIYTHNRIAVILAAVLVIPAFPAMAGKDTPETVKAREMLGLYLRRGQQQAYSGEQVTRLLRGMVRETRQIVKHAGPGRIRMEYVSPPELVGETILIANGRFFQYKPAPENKILEGVTAPEELVARVKDVQRRMREGRIQVKAVGEEEVAGQDTSIVEIRPVRGGGFYLKFWIDKTTGVRLKYNNLDASGGVISESYFTKIDYNPTFSPRDFRPASLPDVPHEALLPKGRPLPTVAAAQAQVGYSIRQPMVPEGFRLHGAWVADSGNRRTTILRYTDGVNNFTLFQSPAPARRPVAANPFRIPRMRNGVAQWGADGMAYILIGNLKPENFRAIAESLRAKE